MSEFVKSGSKVELDVSLEFEDASKFIKVTLTDTQNVALTESPITLTNFGNGRYFDNTLIKKPGTVHALYEIYNDALFSEKSDFKNVVQRFIDPPFSLVLGGPLEIELIECTPFIIDIGESTPFTIELGDCDV